MKGLVQFLKATAVGGLIVIVPLAIVLVAFSSLLQTVIAFGAKLQSYFGFDWLDNPVIVTGIAILLIIALCFITGLLLLTGPGKSISRAINSFLVDHIPMYGAVQNLTAQFAGMKTDETQPVMADLHGSGTWVLGFLVEELADGKLAIFVPMIPVATVGQLYYIDRARVTKLEVKMMDVVATITQWGVGSKILFEQHHRDANTKSES